MILDKIELFFFHIASLYQKSIGISFDEKNIYLVELQRTLKDTQLIQANIYPNNPLELKKILSEINCKDKPIAINFFQPVASFKLLSIPKMQETEIDNWLRENYSEFLPSTISIDQIILNHRIVKINEQITILIGIVNVNEINELLSFIGYNDKIIIKIVPGISELAYLIGDIQDGVKLIYILNINYHEIILFKENQLLFYNRSHPYQPVESCACLNSPFRDNIDILYHIIFR